MLEDGAVAVVVAVAVSGDDVAGGRVVVVRQEVWAHPRAWSRSSLHGRPGRPVEPRRRHRQAGDATADPPIVALLTARPTDRRTAVAVSRPC